MSRTSLLALMLGTTLSTGLLAVTAPDASFAADEIGATAQSSAPAIAVAPVETREIVELLSVNGTVVPRQEAVVGIDLTGMVVEELIADEGDSVKKGDVLARLDRSALDTQLAQSDASRAQAEAQIEQVRAQIADARVGVRQASEGYDRAKALQDKGVAAKATLDNALNTLDSARAKLVSAEKSLAASEAQLGVIDAQKAEVLRQIARTDVKAPAAGLILTRSATLGGVVSASSGPLFTMAIDGEFELAARVAEHDLARIRRDMRVATTLAGASQSIAGAVRRISPAVDETTRLGEVRITLPPESGARSGNFARGEIELSRTTGPAVPTSALVYRDRHAFVQRVEEGVVHTTQVEPGARDGTFVHIRSGLAEGQEIVARAGTFVADGDRVKPVAVSRQVGALKP